jgi:hypothetical protein
LFSGWRNEAEEASKPDSNPQAMAVSMTTTDRLLEAFKILCSIPDIKKIAHLFRNFWAGYVSPAFQFSSMSMALFGTPRSDL